MHSDPQILAAYAERRLPEPESADLEAHLADCPDCREEVRLLVTPERKRFSPWIPAAAAALLLAAVLVRPKPATPSPPSYPSVASHGSWRLSGGDRILLDRLARAERLSGTLVELRAGRLWMDTTSPRVVRVPLWGEVKAADAEIVVEVMPLPGRTSWVAQALAGETSEVRVSLRRGTCAILRKDGVPQAAVADAEAFAWVLERARPAALDSLPRGDYLLSVSVKPRKASGDVGLAFPARSRCPFWILGANHAPLPAGQWTRLEVERRGSRIRLRRDGVQVALLEAEAAEAMTPASSLPALRVWGAEIDSKDLRLMEWPE